VLVPLDLLILNDKAEVLVSQGKKPPAKDWLFVSCGRVHELRETDGSAAAISVSGT
jgi:hypothetical protein